MCNCPPGYTGDPYDGRGCRIIPSVILPPLAIEGVLAPLPSSPCNPHPCGGNARCQVVFNTAQCSCLPGMIGTAPSCRPECVSASDCPSGRGCVNNKCVDPCPGTCATDAVCKVVDHSPFCSCQQGFTGNAFSLCRPIPAVGILRRLFSNDEITKKSAFFPPKNYIINSIHKRLDLLIIATTLFVWIVIENQAVI